MLKILKLALISLAVVVTSGNAFAHEFHVETNKTKPLKLRGDAASVVVGNPLVADIAVHDQNLIFVTGRSNGTTNLLIFNAQGNQIYSGDIVVTTDTSTRVAINRAGATNSYNCAPRCSPIAVVGDDNTYFANVVGQNGALTSQADGQ